MTKKKAEPTKVTTNNSKVLTILAIVAGAILFLGGLGIVIVKLIEESQKQVNCCTVNPDEPRRRIKPSDIDPSIDLKPIMYLYPEEETEVSVRFARPELLTTTYPKYNDEWKVVAQPNGDLRDLNGNYYYGLYWEEQKNYEEYNDGFYVEKDNAIKFLEEKLGTLGLNDRERNEFIMFWLPILEKNEKNFVHFEFTDELQAENALIISPAPDSFLRIDMIVEKVKENPNLPEQELPSFERKGFAVVEWGGVRR